jgi:hypothetical protein
MKKLILIAFVCSALYSSATGYFGIKPIVNEPNCYGGTTGSIQLSVLGGTGPFQYAWSGGLPANNAQYNVGGGTYSVTVTDANSQTASYVIVIGQPYAIQIDFTHNAPQSHGADNGSIATIVDGGTPGFTYAWSDGETTPNISGLGAGTYILTVTDMAGCQATDTQILTQPPTRAGNVFFHGTPTAEQSARSLNVSGNNNSDQAASSNEPSKLGQPELKSEDVQLFPNPASNVVTLKTGDVSAAQISVIDMNGQTVSQQKTESTETNLNVSGLQKGNYIIEIKTADGTVVNKTVTIAK